jgi:hypothetical protein
LIQCMQSCSLHVDSRSGRFFNRDYLKISFFSRVPLCISQSYMWNILCHISYEISMVPHLWCTTCLYCFQNIVSHGVLYLSCAIARVIYTRCHFSDAICECNASKLYCLRCTIPCATFPVICILCHISGNILFECTPFKLLRFVNDGVVV